MFAAAKKNLAKNKETVKTFKPTEIPNENP
jgi:hypothetical protein